MHECWTSTWSQIGFVDDLFLMGKPYFCVRTSDISDGKKLFISVSFFFLLLPSVQAAVGTVVAISLSLIKLFACDFPLRALSKLQFCRKVSFSVFHVILVISLFVQCPIKWWIKIVYICVYWKNLFNYHWIVKVWVISLGAVAGTSRCGFDLNFTTRHTIINSLNFKLTKKTCM